MVTIVTHRVAVTLRSIFTLRVIDTFWAVGCIEIAKSNETSSHRMARVRVRARVRARVSARVSARVRARDRVRGRLLRTTSHSIFYSRASQIAIFSHGQPMSLGGNSLGAAFLPIPLVSLPFLVQTDMVLPLTLTDHNHH